MNLETPRLILRPWREEDLEPFAAMNRDPEVMRYFPSTSDLEASRALIERARASFTALGFGPWAVERPGIDPFIGFIGLSVPRFQAHFTPCVEIGWRLARRHWGLGLATEGARAVLDHALGPLGLREVVSFTTETNLPSRRVMDKLGMTHDPADDFRHPKLPPEHPMSPHVLYRTRRNHLP